MFEKEAEEYVMREGVITENDRVPFDNGYGFQIVSFEDEVKKGFRDGAEFGYNKANEWHYPSKGEYPDNNNDILCQIDFETSEVGYFNEMYNDFFTIDGKEIKVIAWKEIVLPELKESE